MCWTRALPLAVFAALAGCAGLNQLGAVNPSERADVRNACEAKARSDHLDIQRWHGIREVNPGQFEVPLTVNYRGREYERVCVYDDRNRSVDIREGSGSYGGYDGGGSGDGGYGGWGGGGGWGNQASERERAREACEAKVRNAGMEVAQWRGLREVSPDNWEGSMQLRWHGQLYDRTCRYRDRGRTVDIDEGGPGPSSGGYNPGWGGSGGGWGGGNANERAQVRDACESKARSDNLQIVSWGPMREVSADHWQTDLRVEWKGKVYERTCLYDVRGRDVKIVDR